MEPDRRHPAYKSGYLAVADGHLLYYELYGNPDGIPALFLHGGPGAAFSESDKALFDPKIYNVILFDQRGAGRSKPFASLEANTTQKLVEDINRLLDFVGAEEALILGGSWGSTLALVYAIGNLERVRALVLRGIFLATKDSTDYFPGGGAAQFFPEAWERFISHVPSKDRSDLIGYYLRQMQSEDVEVRERYTYEWAYYEISHAKLDLSPPEVERLMQEFSYRSLAPLEAHYLSHGCFIPEDYILQNAAKLGSVPVSIVHGRYDVICLPRDAYRLHKQIPNSTLHFVLAGHSATETAIREKLISELRRIGSTLS